jgi:hypothetical protein
MRKPFAFLAAVALATLGLSISPGHAAAQNPPGDEAVTWFPLEQGNEWIFQARGGTRHRIAVDYSFGSYHWLEGIQGESFWTYADDAHWYFDDKLFMYNWDRGAWYPLFLFARDRAQPWYFDLTGNACDTMSLHLQDESGSVVTPVGAWRTTRRYDFSLVPEPNVRCRKPMMASIWVAPGVGPVRFLDTDGNTWNLMQAQVGGRVLQPAFPGTEASVITADWRVTLVLDKARYENQPNTIRCITTPCPSNQVDAEAQVELKITNTSGSTQTLHFRSGQQLDLEIEDAVTGQVVRLWSHGRPFTEALSRIVLAPGETKVLTATLPFTDQSTGAQLDGTYIVRGWIIDTPVAGLQPAVQVDVTIGTGTP